MTGVSELSRWGKLNLLVEVGKRLEARGNRNIKRVINSA
jgi:hypothetical protein